MSKPVIAKASSGAASAARLAMRQVKTVAARGVLSHRGKAF